MAPTVDWYKNNPLTHRDRRLRRSSSEWVRSFACEDLKPLIVCRGPIRKEAMDVFDEMGIAHYGILLSEKDSIVYPNALAPELRQLADNSRVHRVPDYTGATKEERVERILGACYAKGIDIYTIEELGEQVRREVAEMFRNHPRSRVRLKAIG